MFTSSKIEYWIHFIILKLIAYYTNNVFNMKKSKENGSILMVIPDSVKFISYYKDYEVV